jgi:putative resolvase
MNKLVTIKQAAAYLGVSAATLRRWEYEKKLLPTERTLGGQRRYDVSQLSPRFKPAPQKKVTIAYARVSSHDQKEDLGRQQQMLEMFCASRGWTFEVVSDLGSGMNYNKRGLSRLITSIMSDEIDRLVLTHKDRLLRFGAELIFSLCKARKIEVVVINEGSELTYEEELAADVLEIITVFSTRLYGSRSHKNKKLLEGLKKAVADAKK